VVTNQKVAGTLFRRFYRAEMESLVIDHGDGSFFRHARYNEHSSKQSFSIAEQGCSFKSLPEGGGDVWQRLSSDNYPFPSATIIPPLPHKKTGGGNFFLFGSFSFFVKSCQFL
jgi:hypothetical protein